MCTIVELRREMEKKRSKLHAVVNGNFQLLLNKETYDLSTELDELIVRLMKKEMQEKKNVV